MYIATLISVRIFSQAANYYLEFVSIYFNLHLLSTIDPKCSSCEGAFSAAFSIQLAGVSKREIDKSSQRHDFFASQKHHPDQDWTEYRGQLP